MIEIKNFSLSLGKTELFHSCDFKFEGNTIHTIWGDNGSGKTSFFMTLIGLIDTYSGDLVIDHKYLKSLSVSELSDFFSICHSTQPQNDISVIEVFQFSKIEIDHRIDSWNINHLLNLKLNQLSEGQRQWIFIARAFLQDKPILLLDEPTAFLDRKHREKLKELIELSQISNPKTILINTHDIELKSFSKAKPIFLENRTYKYEH